MCIPFNIFGIPFGLFGIPFGLLGIPFGLFGIPFSLFAIPLGLFSLPACLSSSSYGLPPILLRLQLPGPPSTFAHSLTPRASLHFHSFPDPQGLPPFAQSLTLRASPHFAQAPSAWAFLHFAQAPSGSASPQETYIYTYSPHIYPLIGVNALLLIPHDSRRHWSRWRSC